MRILRPKTNQKDMIKSGYLDPEQTRGTWLNWPISNQKETIKQAYLDSERREKTLSNQNIKTQNKPERHD